MTDLNLDYSLLIPEYLLAALAGLVVAVDLAVPRLRKEWLAYMSAAGLVAILFGSLGWVNKESNFAGLLTIDNFTTLFRVLFTGITATVCLMSAHFVRDRVRHAGEYYGLLILSTIGAIYMAAARELLTAYISFELLSFSLYVLVSFLKFDSRSNEGGLKFMLLGAFSSAIFLYGLSLIYGATGTTFYDQIAANLRAGTDGFSFALLMGLVLVVAGLGFKVAAVPFHMWTPDAYEGAPLPITAYLSAASKGGGMALLLRLFAGALLPVANDWDWMVAAIAAVTMTVGNLVALQQHNIKRLLAYSSIGQVGFMLVGIAALSGDGGHDTASALVLHLTGYVISNLAVFVCVQAWYDMTGGNEEIDDFGGMAEKMPLLSAIMTGGLFSLAGMPLFAGFLTKFILFQSAAANGFLWLSSLAVLMSLVSLYYYLQVIRRLYVAEPATPGRYRVPVVMHGLALALMVGVFYVGLYPQHLFEAIHNATGFLFLG